MPVARPRPRRHAVDADRAPTPNPIDTPALPALDGAPARNGGGPPSGTGTAPPPGNTLPLHIALSALAGLVATIVWAVTGGGYYWPAWVWLGVAIPVAIHAIIRFGLSAPA